MAAGLIGALMVYRPGKLPSSDEGASGDVAFEHPLFLNVFGESASPLLPNTTANQQRRTSQAVNASAER